ncbi:kinase-like domain-containing protein [Mycena latifolia]|nr:kinase-like domain-containing protein [Mycena latifolia]
MFQFLLSFCLSLFSLSSHLDMVRSRTRIALEQTVDRTVVDLTVAFTKVSKVVANSIFPPSLGSRIVFKLVVILTLLSAMTALVKTGIGLSTAKMARNAFSVLMVGTSNPYAIRTPKLQAQGRFFKLHTDRGSLLSWLCSTGPVLKLYKRLLPFVLAGFAAVEAVGYGAVLDGIPEAPVALPGSLCLRHPDPSWYNIPEMLRPALPRPNALVDVWSLRRATGEFWGSSQWKALKLIGYLGEGNFGIVVRAQYDKIILAVKRIPKRRGMHPHDVYKSVVAEAISYRTMRDSPVCPLLCGVFHDADVLYLAMECGEESFADYVVPRRSPALIIAAQLVLALQRLHQRGIIHSDLKPANLLLDGRRNPVIIDYGLATPFDLEAPPERFAAYHALRQAGTDYFPLMWATHENPLLIRISGGTPGFISPKALAGEFCSFGSDWFALAVIIHMLLLTNESPQVFGTRWVPNSVHRLSPVHADFIRRLLCTDQSYRFENYARLKAHDI